MERHKTVGNEREALRSGTFEENMNETIGKMGIIGRRSSNDIRASEALTDGEIGSISATRIQDIHKLTHKFYKGVIIKW